MTQIISIYNIKGGVGKTTLAKDISLQLSKTLKVLIIDADAQCSLSSLLLNNDFSEYYDDDSSYLDIWNGIKRPFCGSIYKINPTQKCKKIKDNLFLLAGNLELSKCELQLSISQNFEFTILNNLIGAFHYLIDLLCKEYSIDYVIIDLNPTISSLNKNLLMLSNGFIIPLLPDNFCIKSLQMLLTVLTEWKIWLTKAQKITKDSSYPYPEKAQPRLLSLVMRDWRDNENEFEKIYDHIYNIFIPKINRINMLSSSYYFSKISDIKNDAYLNDIEELSEMILL